MVRTPFGEVTPEQWDDIMTLNLRAPFFLAQAATPHLRAANGVIVNIADLAAFETWPAYVPHGISKSGVVHLTRLADTHSRHRSGAVIHPRLDGRVSLAQAVVQTGQLNGPDDALVAADAALHRCLMTTADLSAAVDRVRGHPRVAAVRRVLRMADGRAESPGESVLRRILVDAGISVTPQLTVHDGPVSWRADLVVDGTPVLVEFDGLVKYGGPDDLVAEKRREDRLRALGYVLVRVTWADLRHPDRVVAEVRRAMAVPSGGVRHSAHRASLSTRYSVC
jgi:hypothetical protein